MNDNTTLRLTVALEQIATALTVIAASLDPTIKPTPVRPTFADGQIIAVQMRGTADSGIRTWHAAIYRTGRPVRGACGSSYRGTPVLDEALPIAALPPGAYRCDAHGCSALHAPSLRSRTVHRRDQHKPITPTQARVAGAELLRRRVACVKKARPDWATRLPTQREIKELVGVSGSSAVSAVLRRLRNDALTSR